MQQPELLLHGRRRAADPHRGFGRMSRVQLVVPLSSSRTHVALPCCTLYSSAAIASKLLSVLALACSSLRAVQAMSLNSIEVRVHEPALIRKNPAVILALVRLVGAQVF